MKRYLREDRDYVRHTFLHQIFCGFAGINLANVLSYYEKCLRF